jgi:hypothetical protein
LPSGVFGANDAGDGVYKILEPQLSDYFLSCINVMTFSKNSCSKIAHGRVHVFLEDLFVQNTFPRGAVAAPASSFSSLHPPETEHYCRITLHFFPLLSHINLKTIFKNHVLLKASKRNVMSSWDSCLSKEHAVDI